MTGLRSTWVWISGILLSVFLLSPSWAQVQAHGKSQRPPAKVKVPPRNATADITAKLQAQAAADAAAANRAQTDAMPGIMPAAATAASPLVPTLTPEAVAGALPAVQRTDDTVATPPTTPPRQMELLIAQQIHVGHLPCELGATVRIEADAAQPGYFNVHAKGLRYRMFPVQTSTGALRLEDKKAGAVWLQLANKSMLMDQKRGRRLADECAHPDQLAYAEAMKTHPPPSLIDTKGMGR